MKVYVFFFTKLVDETKSESFFYKFEYKDKIKFFSQNELNFQPRFQESV